MPLGWERINEKKSQPNKNIVFLKALPGPHEGTSRDYLERIAAQCLPVMNKHHLAVVTLEEYEPNLEFWGRNFNNGEVIQLVLKSSSTGQWLPFRFVQMVMMHELAHCKQMNHSKAFWAVRNEYATDMKSLWDEGYTGDGLWGRGVLLENGAFAREELDAGEVLPGHMCGGTFRSRGGKKRKHKPKITYKEREERRIKKKFGTNGMALGADDETKVKLENGKRLAGKPRVAGSQRGRKLRAAAALARFDVKKEEIQPNDEDLFTDSEAESDRDKTPIKAEPDDAIDINGKRLLDRRGHGMFRVDGDGDVDDNDTIKELMDLQNIPGHSERSLTNSASQYHPTPAHFMSAKPLPISKCTIPSGAVQRTDDPAEPQPESLSKSTNEEILDRHISAASEKGKDIRQSTNQFSVPDRSCPVCSVENLVTALTCIVCLNVLKPEFVPDYWHCKNFTCKASKYINSGDVNLCGVCGTRKCSNGI